MYLPEDKYNQLPDAIEITVSPNVKFGNTIIKDEIYYKLTFINELKTKTYLLPRGASVVEYPFYFVSNIEGIYANISAGKYSVSVDVDKVKIDISQDNESEEISVDLNVIVDKKI